jgi:hypothetical protein
MVMRREFKVVGKIDEDTKVLGTTYGEVREVIEAGFKEQFRMIGRGKGVDTADARARAVESLDEHNKRLYESIIAAQNGLAARGLHVFVEQGAREPGRFRGPDVELLPGDIVHITNDDFHEFKTVGARPLEGRIVRLTKQQRALTGVDKLEVSTSHGPMSVEHYEPLGTKGVAAGKLVPTGEFEASLSGGHLVLKTKANDKPTTTVYRRRVEDKDLTR